MVRWYGGGWRGAGEAGLLVVLVALAGCAAPVGVAPPQTARWPAREVSHLQSYAERMPDAVPEDIARQFGVSAEQLRGQALRAVVGKFVAPPGVVVELASRSDAGGVDAPNAEFLVLTFHAESALGDACIGWDDAVPAAVDRAGAGLLSDATLVRGVRWRLYLPEGAVRGVAVHLGGNKYVRRALLRRGWSVLHSAGTGRYWQRLMTPVDVRRDDCDARGLGGEIARHYDDIIADWPYSLAALEGVLRERQPAMWRGPRVIMGFSVGALGVPATYAYEPEVYDAAVLVAGGANVFRIGQESSRFGPAIAFAESVSEAERDQIDQAFLARTQLDPYATAALLRDGPLRVYHAALDRVVPARCGALLHERLGGPDRMVYPVSHGLLLRVVMRLEAGGLVDWVEEVVGDEKRPRDAG